MKRLLLLFLLTYSASNTCFSQGAFTQSFTTTGTVVNPNSSAQICPPSGQTVTFKANAAWPFGADGVLIIGAGQTVQIPCGSVKDYDSINIAAGGKLEILDGTGWTVIGCRRGFVLNGIIEAKNGTHAGGTFSMNEPDENGNLAGAPISYSITQMNGGNGGAGGAFDDPWNPPIAGGAGGNHGFGNGGGGGGGGNPGGTGGNATINSGGNGGDRRCNGYLVPGATAYGQDGEQGASYDCANCGSMGSSGGFRGKHGGLLYIFATKSIVGSGSIDVSGSKGGNGAYSYSTGCGAGQGGASGGGAGGSGGYAFIRHGGVAPSVSINTSGGLKGTGGPLASCGCDPVYGQPGQDGEDGLSGSFSLQTAAVNYTYQWRRNGTNVAGATNYSHTDNVAGFYDCKITKPDLSTTFTSGAFSFDRDTIYVDATPISVITSVNPGNNQICFGDTATLTAQYVQGQSYQWALNGTPIVGANSNVLHATSPGTYLVAANNTCNSPELSSPVSIVVNNLPSQPLVTFTNNDTICEGQTVTLQSNIASNIEWNTGETTQTITVSQTGDYYVTVTNSSGCQNTSDTLHIEVKPASVDLGADVNLTCGFNYQFNPSINPSTVNTYSWTPNTGFSCTNCPNPSFAPGQGTTNYSLTVQFTNGCSASDNMNLTTETGVAPQICLVTVDSNSIHNEIVWEKPIATQIDSFRIYRKEMFGYIHVGSVHYDSLSSFVDTYPGGDPNVSPHQYAISAIDACGNESALSDSAVTMFVDAPVIQNINDIKIDWTDYIGFSGNFFYKVMRDSANLNDWRQIGSTVAGVSIFIDQNGLNEGSLLKYRVEIVPQNPCVATRAVNHNVTRSNRSNGIVGNGASISESHFQSFRISPNPSNGTFRIESGANLTGATLEISDVNGKLAYSQALNGNSTVQTSLSSGIYFIRILSNDQNFKIVKLVITE